MPTPQAQRERRAAFLVTCALGIFLAVALQIQASHLRAVVHRLDVDAWQQCHERAVNIGDTLNLRAQLVILDPRLAPIYDRHRLIVPDCGERP